jgi:2-succinyl-6-hydroxy-2,4-cyclohexadiene-1-carboxylate synthase
MSGEVLAGLRGGGRMIADQGGQATYLGYSMGGRYLLHLALANPELVDGLVLLGATAGIDDPAERAARAEADRATAARIRELGMLEFLK